MENTVIFTLVASLEEYVNFFVIINEYLQSSKAATLLESFSVW